MFKSTWYESLIKPLFAPPDWIFAPAWAVLYLTILAAFAIFLVTKNENKKSGYIYFVFQLLLNVVWSPVFFGLQNIGFAFFIIILLDIFVFLTIKKFYSVSKLAGIILIPYFIWILYATYLNLGYLILN